jgi:hypothetical protein
MDLGANADGELLQRALDGERVPEPGILELVAVVHAVQAVQQSGLGPRAEFVSDLRARLLADDAAGSAAPVLPDAPVVPAEARPPSADDGQGTTGGTVSVLRVAARPLRLLAAAAASILVVAGALGLASRSALPGDTLYSVRQLLDRAAVQLAGSRFDEGLTYLAQAQEHIADGRDLIDRGAPSTHDLDTAYDAATDATRRARTILAEVYRREHRTDALSQLADFYTRAIPQVDAMRPRVPTGSLPAWQRLRDALGSGQVATLGDLATCAACGDLAVQARQALQVLVGQTTTTRPGSTSTGGGRTPAPGAAPSASHAAGAPVPPAPASRPAATSVPTPGSLPRPGATLPGPALPGPSLPGPTLPGSTLPGITATRGVPLPGGSVNLPSVGVTSSSIGVGGGVVTLPGATVSLPPGGITSSTIVVGGGGATVPSVTVIVPPVRVTVPTPTLQKPTKILP